ncbi:Tyrosinase [Apiospora saccharicola]|uniref:tyrosinase n=1 Tax=Apiospora saccharicola TaxID=335842 RepID=A0ABR1U327_9PEZI
MSHSNKPKETPTELLKRKDITKLTRSEEDNLISAFDAIQKLSPDHEDSFFNIASFHGAPFRGAGYANQNWWGGYCNHGNVLFPTWHRAYVLRLEQSLEKHGLTIKLPYWNEIKNHEKDKPPPGLPEIFLKRNWTTLKGKLFEPNPLYSYTYQKNIIDHASPKDGVEYTKPLGKSTVRYPFSGLYGVRDIDDTEYHNDYYTKLGDEECSRILNDNIKMWLEEEHYPPDMKPPHSRPARLKYFYLRCLETETYTIFSNNTSAQAWNDQYYHDKEHSEDKFRYSLEMPHDGMHLALGGFEVPSHVLSFVRNANGDMGENNTAAFDPIFFFIIALSILFSRSVDGQGPTPGMTGADFLSMDTPLKPFHQWDDPDKPFINDTKKPFLTSKVCGSLDASSFKEAIQSLKDPPELEPYKGKGSEKSSEVSHYARVSDVTRANIRGSFVIAAWAQENPKEGKEKLCRKMVSCFPVLSRWNVADCANCQSHLDIKAHLPLHGITDLDNTTVTARKTQARSSLYLLSDLYFRRSSPQTPALIGRPDRVPLVALEVLIVVGGVKDPGHRVELDTTVAILEHLALPLVDGGHAELAVAVGETLVQVGREARARSGRRTDSSRMRYGLAMVLGSTLIGGKSHLPCCNRSWRLYPVRSD